MRRKLVTTRERKRLARDSRRKVRRHRTCRILELSEQGLTQREIARKLGCSQSTVSLAVGRVERGKGRHRGEDHPKTQLCAADVLAIRKLRKEGYTYREIAGRVGPLTITGVASICKRRTWGHLEDANE